MPTLHFPPRPIRSRTQKYFQNVLVKFFTIGHDVTTATYVVSAPKLCRLNLSVRTFCKNCPRFGVLLPRFSRWISTPASLTRLPMRLPVAAAAPPADVVPRRASGLCHSRHPSCPVDDLHLDCGGNYLNRRPRHGEKHRNPLGDASVAPALVEVWDNLIGDIFGSSHHRWVFVATTFFIFIVISNLTDLVPNVNDNVFHTPIAFTGSSVANHRRQISR